jgi:hypothetical protein
MSIYPCYIMHTQLSTQILGYSLYYYVLTESGYLQDNVMSNVGGGSW